MLPKNNLRFLKEVIKALWDYCALSCMNLTQHYAIADELGSSTVTYKQVSSANNFRLQVTTFARSFM